MELYLGEVLTKTLAAACGITRNAVPLHLSAGRLIAPSFLPNRLMKIDRQLLRNSR